MRPQKKAEQIMGMVGGILGISFAVIFAVAMFLGTIDLFYRVFIVDIYVRPNLVEFLLGIVIFLPLSILLDSWTIFPLVGALLKKSGFTWEIKRHGKPWPSAN